MPPGNIADIADIRELHHGPHPSGGYAAAGGRIRFKGSTSTRKTTENMSIA